MNNPSKKVKFDPNLSVRFAVTVLNELAALRAELVSQRKLLVEILSVTTKEPRRKIKDRVFWNRAKEGIRAHHLKNRVGLSYYDLEKMGLDASPPDREET